MSNNPEKKLLPSALGGLAYSARLAPRCRRAHQEWVRARSGSTCCTCVHQINVHTEHLCSKSMYMLYMCTCMCLCLCLQIVKCITDAQHNAHRVRARSGGTCCTCVHQINVHTERACACACSASLAQSFKCITGAHRVNDRSGGSQSSLAVRFTAKNGGYPGDVKI